MDSARAVQESDLEHFVFVAMGSSNLAGAAALGFTGDRVQQAGCSCWIARTQTPSGMWNRKLSLDKTLFVFANKSGKRIETHCLLLYFLKKLKAAGVESPGKHFMALTEQNSYLAALAREYKFRNIFFDPPGISSHYSGLIHFSLVLAAARRREPSTICWTRSQR